MTPRERVHEYPPEHPNRPRYFPDITLGNWLTMLAIAFAAVGLYVTNEVRAAENAKIDEAQEKSIDRVEMDFKQTVSELKAANVRLEGKIERVDDKLDQILLQLREPRRGSR